MKSRQTFYVEFRSRIDGDLTMMCPLGSKAKRYADINVAPAVAAVNNPTYATFKRTDIELYVPVFTLSIEGNNTLLDQLKTGLKRTINLNKYRSEVTKQTETNNLNYLIDSSFNKFNGLLVLPYEKEDDRTSFFRVLYTSGEIKDLNVLIDGKSVFDVPLKSKEKHKRKILK